MYVHISVNTNNQIVNVSTYICMYVCLNPPSSLHIRTYIHMNIPCLIRVVFKFIAFALAPKPPPNMHTDVCMNVFKYVWLEIHMYVYTYILDIIHNSILILASKPI